MQKSNKFESAAAMTCLNNHDATVDAITKAWGELSDWWQSEIEALTHEERLASSMTPGAFLSDRMWNKLGVFIHYATPGRINVFASTSF